MVLGLLPRNALYCKARSFDRIIYTTRLVDLLDTYGTGNRVSELTHELSGILDVVVSRRELTAPVVDVADVGLSDHFLLQWSVTTAN